MQSLIVKEKDHKLRVKEAIAAEIQVVPDKGAAINQLQEDPILLIVTHKKGPSFILAKHLNNSY